MSDSSVGFLTERQKDIVQNWEEYDENQRREVKNKLRDAITDLHFLRELPPTEAQEVVRDAIGKYRESDHFDNDIEYLGVPAREERARRRVAAKELLSATISALYNGTDEYAFAGGINNGIRQTVEWWTDADENYADEIGQNLVSFIDDSNGSLSTGDLIRSYNEVTPNLEGEELLEEIFRQESFFPPDYPDVIELGYEMGWHDSTIDELKDQRTDLIDSIEERIEMEIPYGRLERVLNYLDVVIEGRKKARKIAHALNNPKVSAFDIGQFTQYEQRKYLELHRNPLNKDGILPDEEDIPEYPELNTQKVPDPTRLEFDQWADLRDIRERYTDDTSDIVIQSGESKFD